MKATRIPADEQYRLIMECRTSGLTDHEWCLQHDIKPGAFYNWVKRLRKAGCTKAPDMAKAIPFVKSHAPVPSGTGLESDGSPAQQGYHDNLPGIRRCCCFAHLRRYFIEAVPKGKELDYSNPATQGVQYINHLFEHERYSSAKKHTPDQRYTYRLEKEKPILDTFWEWISQQSPKKGTCFEKAVNYAQNHKYKFMTYLENGQCSFSNNLIENSIRPFTVGRRNWLFSDTPKGADASSVVYAVVEMATAHSLNIYKYLNFLLERLPRTVMTDDELSKLVPSNKTVQEICSGTM